MFFHSRKKPRNRFHKSVIIHNRIPLVALKPRTCVSVMLGYYYCLWIGFLYSFSEFFPKFMIILCRKSKIGSHIYPPAVCIIWRRNPFYGYVHYILKQFIRLFIVKFGVIFVSPPCFIFIIVGPASAVPLKKVMVWTVFMSVCAFFITGVFIYFFSVHPSVERTAVIKYAVHNNSDFSFMGFIDQFRKKLITCFKVLL